MSIDTFENSKDTEGFLNDPRLSPTIVARYLVKIYPDDLLSGIEIRKLDKDYEVFLYSAEAEVRIYASESEPTIQLLEDSSGIEIDSDTDELISYSDNSLKLIISMLEQTNRAVQLLGVS